jgi:enterochelin esterase family protein
MSAAAAPSLSSGPVIDLAGVTFRLPDPHRRLLSVRLCQQLGLPADGLGFRYQRGVWTLRIDRPPVDRMEYLLELEHPNGGRETVTDRANPSQVPGAFGNKSVIEFPGYRRPSWLVRPTVAAAIGEFAIPSSQLASTVRGLLWSPDGLDADRAAPMLIANDGPEYASLASLIQYAGAVVGSGELPPFRIALLAPGDRNLWYAVNPAYARAMNAEVIPALQEIAPATRRIGMGASLGALAMLHGHRSFPSLFDGLFLQSGSFFRPDLDPQERRFSRFGPVTRFVAEVIGAVTDPAPIPTVLTCGIEENLDNNRLMATTLQGLGYPAELHEVRDVHNYTAWRDAFDPYLTGLLSDLAGGARAS